MDKKKLVLLVVALSVLAALTASCETTEEPAIEDYVWEMAAVLKNGEAAYVIEDDAESYPDAETASWLLSAENGILTLKDLSRDRELKGGYSPTSVFGKKEKIYNVDLFYEGEEFASVSHTVYADGTERPTLIVSLPGTSGYAAYFYPLSE